MASSFLKHPVEWEISIPETFALKGVIFYVLCVKINATSWTVKRRYTEFASLHKNLVLSHGVSKDMLPGKRLFNIKNETFIESRRLELQSYINNILRYLSNTMPPELVNFLELEKYDLWFLLKKLSEQVKVNRWIETSPDECEISLIEVSAITDRHKLPSPPAGILNIQEEFSTVLEFCSFLRKLHIKGENSDYFGTSNISYKQLPFDLSSFKCLNSLILSNIFIRNLTRADEARHQIKYLTVNHCGIVKLAEILLCDHLHLDWQQCNSTQMWHMLKKLDVQFNNIVALDTGLELMPSVTELNASNNNIQSLKNVSKLTNLCVLSMSHNNIVSICDLQLPFLTYLNVSNNQLKSITGIELLPLLENLYLSFNFIEEFEEINELQKLKKLININLIGNPISQKTDYRLKVLLKFGSRAPLVCLDNEMPTNNELELVAVIQAINFVQEGKSPSYSKTLSVNNNIVV